MSTRTSDYKEAIDHLPIGATLVFEDVTWEEYEQLLSDIDRPAIRMTYDHGKLVIMGPRPEHEEYKCLIDRIVDTVTDVRDLNLEPRGSATWRKKAKAQGTEPDCCYYIARADRIIGKRDINLEVDPPPDLAVEIDSTSQSTWKFHIYATLGVPEIWRYHVKRKRVHLYELRGDAYVELPASVSFPILTPDVIADCIEYSDTHGQKAALAKFRRELAAST